MLLLLPGEPAQADADAGVEAALEGIDPWWRSTAETAIAALAETGRPFDVGDVRDMGVTEPDHPNRWGAVFMAASRSEMIRPLGALPSQRPSRHRGLVRRWIGRGGDAA
jgi:hypothetical protein